MLPDLIHKNLQSQMIIIYIGMLLYPTVQTKYYRRLFSNLGRKTKKLIKIERQKENQVYYKCRYVWKYK